MFNYSKVIPLKTLIIGIRPKTLANAISPVMAGSATSLTQGKYNFWLTFLCLLVAGFLTIGVNLANDYSDGIKGVDNNRIGPPRLVANGLATASQVKILAISALAIAAFIGTYLAYQTSLIFLIIGGLGLLAAWFYTGGKYPYGYYGLGELVVFIFYGLIATLGTEYIVAKHNSVSGYLAAIVVGAFSMTMLLINNYRDLTTDLIVKKNTLVVKLGEGKSKILYLALLTVPIFLTLTLIWLNTYNILLIFSLPLVLMSGKIVFTEKSNLINGIGLIAKSMLTWATLLLIASILVYI